MTPERWQSIRPILDRALELRGEERTTFLREHCGDDAALRADVETLLRADARQGLPLDAPVAEYADALVAEIADRASSGMVGRRVGRYRLVGEIGRGGMGTVYLAKRDDGQFEQYVAVKLLRRELLTQELRGRFLAERQILASLSHPNIGRLLDGGATQDGLPYLAMEYVEGQPIDAYSDANRLTVRQRLSLFLTVANAVQHAHRNLVVHRDLKPSNILVTAAGEVKLLDFGIAKLMRATEEAAGAEPQTRAGLRLMTPEYATPEQVKGEPVSTASDVYQLGLLLFELMTGGRPYGRQARTPAEVERSICDDEPPKPSAVITRKIHASATSSGEPSSAALVAAARQTTPERLRKEISGDLEAITLKALRKESDRRYSSAEALVADIERYLRGLPVHARGGSRAYQARRFARRHRWSVVAGAAFVLLLVTFAAAMAVQAGRLSRERDRAENALRQAEEVSTLLSGLFEANDPWQAQGDTITARELLQRGVVQAQALSGHQLVKARVLDVLGGAYLSLGEHEQARPLLLDALALRQANLGEVHIDVAETLTRLGLLTRTTADFAAARSYFTRALDIQRRVLGEEHPDIASTLIALGRSGMDAERAGSRYAEALALLRRTVGPEHPSVVTAMDPLASNLRRRGRYEDAEALWREALRVREKTLDPDDPEVANGMVHLADLLSVHRGQPAEAESLYRRALAIQRRRLGDRHPALMHGLGSLASLLTGQREYAEAEALLRESLALRRDVFGPDHTATTDGMGHLAAFLMRVGRLGEAEALGRQVVSVLRRILGPTHPATAGSMVNLAEVLAARHEYAEAEALYRDAVAVRENIGGPDAAIVGATLSGLGDVLRRKGDFAAAEKALQEGRAILRQYFDHDHMHVHETYERLVLLYDAADRPEDAARYEPLIRSELHPAP